MKYLEELDLRKKRLLEDVPGARSVIVLGVNYYNAVPAGQEPLSGKVARYAWGREDYHDSVLRRVREVESKLKGIYADEGPVKTRSYVDTGPLVERVYARYAGVGWFGKNTCVINQKLGSWLFLAVIVTSIELSPDLPAPDRCGTCT
jgi:epoxyqueuosine reductase